MKKILLSLGIIVGSAVAAQAQENVIKLNVTSLTIGAYNASFEHKLSDKSSFQIGAFYASYGTDPKFTGFGITPEYRFYLTSKDAPRGFFLGPFVRYQNYNLSLQNTYYYNNSSGQYVTGEEKATLNTFGGGVNIGYQWVFGGHFAVESFLRLGYNSGTAKSDGNVEDFTLGIFKGTSVLPGLNLGYAL